MEIDVKQLFNLLAISRLGSFSSAAKARKLSQPALSSSISQLEKYVGTQLLSRGRYGARLTDAGQTLIRRAEIVETQMLRAREDLTSQEKGFEGPIVVGVTPVAAAHLVPRALGRLQARVPQSFGVRR